MRPNLVTVMTSTPGVAPYFDLSFQHSSGRVLRAMRRFGDTERFCALLDQIRDACPDAGVRSNFIVGFPGETPDDLAELERFLSLARLDAVGIFGYSDEDGTEAASLAGHVDPGEVARRVDDLSDLAEEVMAQRAAERVGETVAVLIEECVGGGTYVGRAAHQAPEVDGVTTLTSPTPLAVGDIAVARVVDAEGVDLVAEAVPGTVPARGHTAAGAQRELPPTAGAHGELPPTGGGHGEGPRVAGAHGEVPPTGGGHGEGPRVAGAHAAAPPVAGAPVTAGVAGAAGRPPQ
jgi:hypothetical protein